MNNFINIIPKKVTNFLVNYTMQSTTIQKKKIILEVNVLYETHVQNH